MTKCKTKRRSRRRRTRGGIRERRGGMHALGSPNSLSSRDGTKTKHNAANNEERMEGREDKIYKRMKIYIRKNIDNINIFKKY